MAKIKQKIEKEIIYKWQFKNIGEFLGFCSKNAVIGIYPAIWKFLCENGSVKISKLGE